MHSLSAHHEKYVVQKTFENGVRLGKIPSAKKLHDREDFQHAWFPKRWKDGDVKKAGLVLLLHPKSWFKKKEDNVRIVGNVDNVNVGVKVDKGIAKTIFPLYNQNNKESVHVVDSSKNNGK